MGSSRGGPYEFSPDHNRYLRRYVVVFLQHAGPPPWPCHRCGNPVFAVVGSRAAMPDGCVHHLDEDISNEDPGNLGPEHRSCHTTEHMVGHPVTERQRAASRAPKPRTAQHAAAISAAKLTPVSDELRAEVTRRWAAGYESRKQLSAALGLGLSVLDRILREEGPIQRTKRCDRGHEMTPDNTYEQGGCLTCRRKRALDYYHAHRNEQKTREQM